MVVLILFSILRFDGPKMAAKTVPRGLLGGSWAVLGPSWGGLGPLLGAFGLYLGGLGARFGSFGARLGVFWGFDSLIRSIASIQSCDSSIRFADSIR